MNKKKLCLEVLNFRHACKIFDESKKITDEDFSFLLESARLSPTSFGIQGVQLTVITNKEFKEKLRPLCWDQPQITTCSHLVVYKTKTAELRPGSKWVEERFLERGLPKDACEKYLKVYKNFHDSIKCKDIYEWGARQAYILFSTMINAAAFIGIDSCPIEGFEKEQVEKVLEIDTNKEEIALLCCFGYRVSGQPPKRRIALDEMVEFVV